MNKSTYIKYCESTDCYNVFKSSPRKICTECMIKRKNENRLCSEDNCGNKRPYRKHFCISCTEKKTIERKHKARIRSIKYYKENYTFCYNKNKEYYNNKKEILSEKSRKKRSELSTLEKEDIKVKRRKYRLKNKERLSIIGKKKRDSRTDDEIKIDNLKKKNYREKNKEKIAQSGKLYREKNKDIINKRYKENPHNRYRKVVHRIKNK